MSVLACALVVVVSMPVALLLHELAHAAMALVLGGHHLAIARRGALCVVVSATFADARASIAFVAAGPLASIAVGAWACACAGGAVAMAGAVSAAFGVVTACGEDGREIVRLLRARNARLSIAR